ncbi:hypothetical protein Rhal01_00735 [Rubritalea halochordaticola]|uniref:Peptidase C39-like domain-containing protein n=1 Tax=Rubritalea halochordaticola TaxID=714537 RepID=A0ABP9UVT4_9BACT
MKKTTTLLLIAALNLTGLAQARQFWRHEQKQQNVGSCHTFATLALLEAEYYLVNGRTIDLSERDLFTRHLMRGYRSSEEMIRGQLTAAAHKKLSPFYKEAASPVSDFDLVKAYGVALEKEVPYESSFSPGMSMLMDKLRNLRTQVNKSASQMKTSGRFSRAAVQNLVSQHMDDRLTSKLSIKPNLSSRNSIRHFAQQYSFKKVKPSSASNARQTIMQQLKTRPVAVDVKDYSTLHRSPGASIQYRYHCVVISGYDSKKDQFIIRNSNSHASSESVSAEGLCKLAYNIYYLGK